MDSTGTSLVIFSDKLSVQPRWASSFLLLLASLTGQRRPCLKTDVHNFSKLTGILLDVD
nr:uncharacterized protein CTRU02_08570 [Colletotrichum truncatum]KAF6789871.1 hypothetical protein CTRU02_08570 [Colletotrichum truncatum]